MPYDLIYNYINITSVTSGIVTTYPTGALAFRPHRRVLHNHFSFCHCVVCPSSIYGFRLPLWHLQTLFPSVVMVWLVFSPCSFQARASFTFIVYQFTLMSQLNSPRLFSSVCMMNLFCVLLCRSWFFLLSFFLWPMCCLSIDLRIIITSLISSNSIYQTCIPRYCITANNYLKTFTSPCNKTMLQ